MKKSFLFLVYLLHVLNLTVFLGYMWYNEQRLSEVEHKIISLRIGMGKMEQDTMMNFSISKYNFYSSKFTTNNILSILNEKHSVLTKKQQILVINKQWKDFLERLPFANTESFLYQPTISEDIENYRFTKQFNDAMGFVKNNPDIFENLDRLQREQQEKSK